MWVMSHKHLQLLREFLAHAGVSLSAYEAKKG